MLERRAGGEGPRRERDGVIMVMIIIKPSETIHSMVGLKYHNNAPQANTPVIVGS